MSLMVFSITLWCSIDWSGPEIWNQTEGKVDGFICAIGTGGTVAGVGKVKRGIDCAVNFLDNILFDLSQAIPL